LRPGTVKGGDFGAHPNQAAKEGFDR